jgi:hypothetical protein
MQSQTIYTLCASLMPRKCHIFMVGRIPSLCPKMIIMLYLSFILLLKLGHIKLVWPCPFYWSSCTKLWTWAVMYVCVRDIHFVSFYGLFFIKIWKFNHTIHALPNIIRYNVANYISQGAVFNCDRSLEKFR